MINLTTEERLKFARYLEQEARTGELLMEQMKKMPSAVMGAMINRQRQEIVAQRIVAAKLASVEEQTIG